MKKYIFTEAQIKKIIDSQINEDFNQQQLISGSLATLDYSGVDPKLAQTIKTAGRFVITKGNVSGVSLNGAPAKIGSLIGVGTKITMGINNYIVMSGMHLPEAGISYGQNGLIFSQQVA